MSYQLICQSFFWQFSHKMTECNGKCWSWSPVMFSRCLILSNLLFKTQRCSLPCQKAQFFNALALHIHEFRGGSSGRISGGGGGLYWFCWWVQKSTIFLQNHLPLFNRFSMAAELLDLNPAINNNFTIYNWRQMEYCKNPLYLWLIKIFNYSLHTNSWLITKWENLVKAELMVYSSDLIVFNLQQYWGNWNEQRRILVKCHART